MRSCRTPLPTHVDDQKTVDSIQTAMSGKITAVLHERDSALDLKEKEHKRGDSLQKIVSVDQISFGVKEHEISSLLDNANRLKENRDTAGLLANCDSIKNELPKAAVLINTLKKDRDDLDSSYTEQLRLSKQANLNINQVLTESNNSLFDISRKYGNLTEDYKKALKQNGKRWSVGPGIGGTVVNGKFAPVIDFSIHYDLFKF